MSPPRQAHAQARAANNYPTNSINANDRDTAHQNDFSLNAAGVNRNSSNTDDRHAPHPNHLIHPNADGVNIELQAAGPTMIDINTPENTRRVASPKIEEFFEFCDYRYVFAHQPNPRHLTSYKAYRFMLYLAFREKKPSRGKVGAGGAGRFDRDEYNRIVHFSVAPGAGDVASNIPQAVNPIGPITFSQYKYVLRLIYKHQTFRQDTSLTFDQIWTILSRACEAAHTEWSKFDQT
jgi:hypothetical protein